MSGLLRTLTESTRPRGCLTRHRAPPMRQRGAALVISAIVITTIMAFAVLTSGRAARSELTGAYHGSVALQALLSAETGLQRGTKRYTQGLTACASISETLTNYPTGYNVIILGKSTDFSNVALGVTGDVAPPTGTVTSCRIEATAVHAATGVSRKVSQIVDESLFDLTSENLDFNTGSVDGWTFTAGFSYPGPNFKTAAGNDGTHPACTQGAYLGRTTTTRYALTGQNNIYFNHDTAADGNFTVYFSRRYLGADDSNSNFMNFRLLDASGNLSTQNNELLNPGSFTYSGANPPSIAPAPFACNDNYVVNDARTTSVIASRVNPMSRIQFYMEMRSNGTNKEYHLDNLSIAPPAITSGGTYTRIRQWRECVPASNNCP
jgi:hypothetical protein